MPTTPTRRYSVLYRPPGAEQSTPQLWTCQATGPDDARAQFLKAHPGFIVVMVR